MIHERFLKNIYYVFVSFFAFPVLVCLSGVLDGLLTLCSESSSFRYGIHNFHPVEWFKILLNLIWDLRTLLDQEKNPDSKRKAPSPTVFVVAVADATAVSYQIKRTHYYPHWSISGILQALGLAKIWSTPSISTATLIPVLNVSFIQLIWI